MSKPKMDRSFTSAKRIICEAELARIIARALRQDFGETPSAIKRIGQLVNVNLRTIKNWYSAANAPYSSHLLLLARSSPSILKFVLEQIGGADLLDAFMAFKRPSHRIGFRDKTNIFPEIYSADSCTINVTVLTVIAKKLNQRQLWFLSLLKQNQRGKTGDIVYQWRISLRTAKSDIAALVELGLIQFAGARRTGFYVLQE